MGKITTTRQSLRKPDRVFSVPTEADYMRALATACPPDAWAQIVAKQVEMALAGNTGAAAFLAKLLLHKAPRLTSTLVQEGHEETIDDLINGLGL